MDIMAVYLKNLYNIFARGSDAIVGNRAWQHSENKKEIDSYQGSMQIYAKLVVFRKVLRKKSLQKLK